MKYRSHESTPGLCLPWGRGSGPDGTGVTTNVSTRFLYYKFHVPLVVRSLVPVQTKISQVPPAGPTLDVGVGEPRRGGPTRVDPSRLLRCGLLASGGSRSRIGRPWVLHRENGADKRMSGPTETQRCRWYPKGGRPTDETGILVVGFRGRRTF